MALHSHYDYEGLHLMMFVTIITTAHPWEVSCGALQRESISTLSYLLGLTS
jgi:hypothetical protein